MNLNLENLKVGDEVTTVYVDKNRNRDGRKYGGVYTVLGWSEQRKMWQITGMNYVPKDGKGYFTMHSRETPHFYFSANPVHIKAAKKEQSKIAAKLEKQNKLLAEKRELISCFSEDYRDSEEGTFPIVSIETMERLTIPQLKTLKTWLSV